MALRKVGQRFSPTGCADEIGHDKNQGSSLHDSKSCLHKIAQVGRGGTRRLRTGKYPVENMKRVAPAAARRNNRINAVAIQQRPDAIPVTRQ
jgi:hypothetical protein